MASSLEFLYGNVMRGKNLAAKASVHLAELNQGDTTQAECPETGRPDVSENTMGQNADPQIEMNGLFTRAVRALGFSMYSYLSPLMPGKSFSDSAPTFLTNYPPEWRQRYLWNSYHLSDPVAILGRKSRMPFTWGNDAFLKGFCSKERIVIYEAREFGVSRGFTIPIHGPGGEYGLFTVASSEPDSYFRDAITEHAGELHLLGIQVHALCMERFGVKPEEDQIELSSRERECLIWTARGKTSEEIALIINRSVPTVNYHLQKAMRKLNAVNKFQAVIKAYEYNLLI